MFSRIALRRDGDGNRLELQTMRLWRSPESLSLPVHAHFRRPHPESGQRRCSMAMCGNRPKQAAHRHRLKVER
jgi:hypothetical protein